MLVILPQDWLSSGHQEPWLWQRVVGLAKSTRPLPWAWQHVMPPEGDEQEEGEGRPPLGGSGWHKLTSMR